MTQKPMYQTIVGDASTLLTAPYTAGTDTTVSVEDTSWLPAAPNSCTIAKSDKSAFVTIRYGGISAATLTDVTVIQASSDAALTDIYPNGSVLSKPLAQDDMQSIQDNVADHEQRLEVVEQTALDGVTGVKLAGTELQKDAENKVDIPVAGSGLGVVKSGTEAVVSTDGSIDISTATNRLENAINAVSDDLDEHLTDFENPHNVTKEDVGLGNADNTSDLNKPISTATQEALDLKADDSDLQGHVADKTNPHAVTKTQVGLGNADNTSDLNKPISTAVGAALAQKADASTVTDHIADVTNPHEVTKAQVGLGNVDNTSDANKPVSTAVQTALDGKVDKETGKGLSSNDYTDADKEALEGAVSDIADHIADTTNPHEVTATQIGVEEGAEVNVIDGIKIGGIDQTVTSKKVNVPIASTSALGVIKVGANLTISADGTLSATGELTQPQADWAQTDPTAPDFIKGKPELGTAASKDTGTGAGNVILGNDSRLTDTRIPKSHASTHYGSGADAIPEATQTTNGLMSSADKTKLNGIEAQAQKNVQSDWNAVSGDKFIANKPEALSDFSNDENFQTDTQVASAISTHDSSNTAHSDIRGLISSEVSRAEGEEQSLQNQIDALASKTDVVDVVGTKAELLAYDTSALANNDIVKVLVDESQSNAISYYRWVITAGTGAWNYVGSQGPFYTKSEADNYFVPQQRTVNGKSLANNVTLGASDVSALPDTATLADLDDDSTHRLVTDTQIASWNAKQGALTFDSTPTASSTNPVTSGGVYSALSGKADETDLQAHIDDDENPHGVTAAQVGLGNVNNTSDADKPISDATATALSGKVDKVEGKGLSDANYTAAEKSKLAGIETGAQANVQPDWNATSGMQAIANKPELGSAASKNVPATGDATTAQVVLGSDSRLTNARAPTTHASTHATGGSDAISPSSIGAEPAIGTKATAFNKDFGSSAGTVCEGNDTRLTNARTPIAHASSHGSGGSDPITPASIGAEASFSKNTAFNKNFGSSAGTVCEGNDARLSDARTPTAHNHAAGDITSGTLADARIPSLAASKITSGTFDVARIPSLTKDKISDFPTSMTPTAHVSTHKSGGSDALYSVATATLTTSGWSSKSQTVSVSGVTTSNTVIVAPAPASIDVWSTAGCKCSAQGSGTLTFSCEAVPTASITVNVMVML